MDIVSMVVALALVGFFVGFCSGLLGIGGGTMIVPILRLAFAFDAITATATSLFSIIFTSLSGAGSHLHNRTCIPKLGIALGLGGAVTSSLGVALASMSPSWAIMLVAAIIIAYSAYNMLKKALKLPKGGKRVPGAKGALPEKVPDFIVTPKTALCGVGIGLIAGLASGYVGVGGGFIMVPLMTSWLGVPMKKASGTSLIAIIILAIPGVISHAMLGHIDYLAGLLIVVGSIPGAMVGAKMVTKVNERTLRFLFAAFLGVAAIMLVVNEFHVLG